MCLKSQSLIFPLKVPNEMVLHVGSSAEVKCVKVSYRCKTDNNDADRSYYPDKVWLGVGYNDSSSVTQHYASVATGLVGLGNTDGLAKPESCSDKGFITATWNTKCSLTNDHRFRGTLVRSEAGVRSACHCQQYLLANAEATGAEFWSQKG